MIHDSKRQDPCAKPGPMGEPSLDERLPPRLRADLQSLRSQENRILESLNADPRRAAAFLADPARELKRAGVKVPSDLRASLKPVAGLEELLKPASIRLPNGQVITPKVKLRITGGV
ncbi:MAG TPA: hypothetical protein PKO15_09265 [Fibrobacteria bacterium]|nr:hypothetical protein [Fibrobacteria bacterium]HOX50647.1 hypothetical protein [Fibrobacteria bacterium]